MKVRKYYEQLGGYLYVLSKADGDLQAKEEKVLMDEILEIINEYPGFEKNAEVQGLLLTKLCYYNREKESYPVSHTANEFREFINANRLDISDKSKSIGLRLIRKVANAYKGLGHAERKVLLDIEDLLSVSRESKSEGA